MNFNRTWDETIKPSIICAAIRLHCDLMKITLYEIMTSDFMILSIFGMVEVNNSLPVSSYFIWEKEKALLSDSSKFKDFYSNLVRQ